MYWIKISILIITLLVFRHLRATPELLFSDSLFSYVQQHYGNSALSRVQKWQQVINDHQNAEVKSQLLQVNQFFNNVNFVDDIQHWKKADYWATPIEFLGTNGGDCEDFTIAKYFSLRAMGVPSEKLRLMYVTALRMNQAHMVLAYYETPNAIPLVLDNINPNILPATSRRDLAPIYSFNGDGLWAAKEQGRGRQLQTSGNHSLWENLTKRIQQGQ